MEGRSTKIQSGKYFWTGEGEGRESKRSTLGMVLINNEFCPGCFTRDINIVTIEKKKKESAYVREAKRKEEDLLNRTQAASTTGGSMQKEGSQP